MSVTFLKSAVKLEDLPRDGKPHVAMVGRSNVGKSSLINDLAGEKNLARVSAEPGRTQMINLFDVDGLYFLTDLPGYGFAKTSKTKRQGFSEMITDYLWQTQELVLVVLIIDARIGPTDLDRDTMEYLHSGDIPFVLVANKIDKLSRSETMQLTDQLIASYPHLPIILHSNVSGVGKGELKSVIERYVKKSKTTS